MGVLLIGSMSFIVYVVLLLFIALLCHAVGMMISRITLFNKIVYGQF